MYDFFVCFVLFCENHFSRLLSESIRMAGLGIIPVKAFIASNNGNEIYEQEIQFVSWLPMQIPILILLSMLFLFFSAVACLPVLFTIISYSYDFIAWRREKNWIKRKSKYSIDRIMQIVLSFLFISITQKASVRGSNNATKRKATGCVSFAVRTINLRYNEIS